MHGVRWNHMKTFIVNLLRGLHQSPRLNSGQAIVIIGAASIGLIAMMGLAIDGGRLLFLQRDVQNAADAAALAAARALCTERDPVPFALAAADENGFDNNGDDNTVTVNTPPENAGFDIEDYCEGCYVEVQIDAKIPPTFIGIVYGGELAVTAHAIGACNPDMDAAKNAAPELRAVWAMNNACPPNSVEIAASDIVIIGGAHSNGEIKIMPSTGGGSVIGATSYVDGSGVHDAGKVTYDTGDGGENNTGETFTGTCLSTCFSPEGGGGVDEGTYPATNPYKSDPQTEYPLDHDIADYQLPDGSIAQIANAQGEYFEWDCSGPANKFDNWLNANHVHGGTIDNGIYYADCDIKVQGLDNVTGNVTFVATGTIDVIQSNGQHLNPYQDDLLYFTTANTGCNNAFQFSGSGNTWTGNIFAPNGAIKMSASSHVGNGCTVGQAVEISGSGVQLTCDVDTEEHIPNPGIWFSE